MTSFIFNLCNKFRILVVNATILCMCFIVTLNDSHKRLEHLKSLTLIKEFVERLILHIFCTISCLLGSHMISNEELHLLDGVSIILQFSQNISSYFCTNILMIIKMNLSILYSSGCCLSNIMKETSKSFCQICIKMLAMIIKDSKCVFSDITKMKPVLGKTITLLKFGNNKCHRTNIMQHIDTHYSIFRHQNLVELSLDSFLGDDF